MTDTKKQTIKKITLIVKDDFFDDIVNGLKSPIEEKIEKQDADNSKVELGGQQLQRVKKSILPEISKAIKNGELIQTYVDETRTQYQKLKIAEIKDYIETTQEGMKELEEVEEEAEDELEELKTKKGGQLFGKFLSSMNKIRKAAIFALRFYGYYAKVGGMFDKSKLKLGGETMNEFNLSDYNMEYELERDKACRDFSKYLHTTVLERIKEFLSPFMFHITKGVYAATDMVFAKVNRKIWIWIAKQAAYFLWEIALTVALNAIAAALTASGVGTAAGVALFAATALRIANLTRKIAKFGKVARGLYKTFSRGGKFVRALSKGARKLDQLRRSKAVRNAGAGAMKLLRRAKRMPKKQRRELINDVADTVETVAHADEAVEGALLLGELLTIDKEDIRQFRNNINSACISMGNGVYRSLDDLEKYIRNSDSKTEASTYKGRIYSKISEKYGVKIKDITNTGLDIDVVGEAIQKLSNGIDIPSLNVEKPKSLGQSFTFSGFSVNAETGLLSFKMGNGKVFNFDETTHKRMKMANGIKEPPVKLKKDGKSLSYDKGTMSGVWLQFESKYLFPHIRKIRYNKKDIVNIVYNPNNIGDENTLHQAYFGIQRIPNANEGNEILTKERFYGLEWEHTVKDLSEIIAPRNTWLKSEKDILSKLQKIAEKLKITV